jgi:hypothetical protein
MADQVIAFTQEGEFEAYHAACAWCEENGYSHGSMQRDAPIGILKGDWIIAKWRNLSAEEREHLDGTITCIETFREAPIHIVIKGESL